MAERAIVNVVSGFLGVGKTTAINELLGQRPVGEKWAVVVNEFGDIGIDGTLLTDRDRSPEEVVIHEIPGGCICCTAGFAFQEAVVRLLRRERPDRLLIEPTGIATLRSIIDTFRQPGLAEAVELRTIITLVDPAHWMSPRHRNNDTYQDQIEAADVLLANRSDLREPMATERFLQEAGELFPPKRKVAVVDHGRIEATILDVVRDSQAHSDSGNPGSGSGGARADGIRAADPVATGPYLHQITPVTPGSDPLVHRGLPHGDNTGFQTVGRIFPPETVFDELCLADWIVAARSSPHVLRVKGVFHTTGGWISYNATPQEQSLRAASHRRDSRVECVLDAPAALGSLAAPTAPEDAPAALGSLAAPTAREVSTSSPAAPDAPTTPADELLAGVERCTVERPGAVQAPATE